MASTSSQEASTSNSPRNDQIFLSFRGEDTRKNFVNHLYTALNYAGFHTFRDNDGIERGEHIKSELQKAIQESRIALVVLSKNYASSSWYLDELVMILKCRRTISGYVVLPLFYHVDPSDVRNQLGSFKEAFREHGKKIEAKSGETRNEWISKVKEWREALKEVANLGGMNLQDMADGHEARFIQKIIKVVGDKLSRTALHIGPYAIGIHARARKIQFWLEDGSPDVGLAAICGMGGIGKTTIAKFLYNFNFSRFDGSSFLADVRKVSKQQYGLPGLQRQLVADILKGRNEKISDVDEGIVKIKSALSFKRVLVVIDNVDQPEQLEAVLGMRDWFFPGSKFIITTRHEHLLKPHEGWKVHRIEKLDDYESLELFSLHAFGQSTPDDDFADASNLAVKYCEGLPLAIKVLGSSLGRSRNLEVWKSQLEKLKAIPNNEILEKLKVSYDSLDEHDQNLFLHLACFFVGCHKDYTITILDGCEFYTLDGIDNLIGRCLVTVDEFNKVVMHRLLQEMGRDIVRQESPKNPGKRSRLWNHKDSYKVLSQNKGTSEIQGLVLDMGLLKDDESSNIMLAVNSNHSLQEFLNSSLLSTLGNWLQRCCLCSADSNQMVLEADAFAKMENLKLLQLGDVRIIGSYEHFPKEIRWLCWHGFPFQSIPNTFPLETMVALEMPRSNLKILFDRAKFLVLLKILNLSHSHSLASTPDFRALPNLERLLLEDCTRLVEIDESIGQLERLVLLNLRDCSNLRRLPKSIGMLESLQTLDIFGCSNLENSPTEMGNMDSLPVVGGDQDSTIQNVKARRHLFLWPWPLKPRKNLEPSWVSSLPRSLVRLNLDGCNLLDRHSFLPWPLKLRKNPEPSWVSSLPRSLVRLNLDSCNLSDNAFPKDLSNLFSLQELSLKNNHITSLPDFVRGLTKLNFLCVDSCKKLRSFVVLQELKEYSVTDCESLGKVAFLSPAFAESSMVREQGSWEKTTFLSPAFSSDQEYEVYYIDRKVPTSSCDVGCNEFSGKFKLEPLGNVDEKIINNLGLFNLGSMGNLDVLLLGINGLQRVPPQGCHEQHVFYTYLPGSKVPEGFNPTTKESSLSFTPPSHNSRIRGLSLCTIYGHSPNIICDSESNYTPLIYLNTVISNTTKRLIWSHCPAVTGIPEEDGDMVWLSYWKFENQVESGDELNISVSMTEGLQVKEVGVRLLHEVAETEMITAQIPSTSEIEEEEVPEEIYHYGLSLPGNASSDQGKTRVFTFGAAQLDLIRTLQLGTPTFKYCSPPWFHPFRRLRSLQKGIPHSLIFPPSGKLVFSVHTNTLSLHPSDFPTPDKQDLSTPDPNSWGERDSGLLQLQVHQYSDAKVSMSDHGSTSGGTAPEEGVLKELNYYPMEGFPTPDNQDLSMPDPNLKGEKDSGHLQLQVHPYSDAPVSMSDRGSTSGGTALEEGVLKEFNDYPIEDCPLHFSEEEELEEIDLSSKEMKSLPQDIFGLVSLRKLFLRSCAILMMELPPEIGELTNLEVLDLEGTEILCLPKEIAKLVKLTCLKVSFYGYANQTVIPKTVLSNLSRLKELIIDVTPYGEWWDIEVEAIIDDLRNLKELTTLKLYIPTPELLKYVTSIFPGLANFRFTVGHQEEHFISRLPRNVEEEFNNWEKLEKGLKFINGDCIPNEITKVLKHADAFFLQRHWTAESLSEFGHENLNEVKFFLVMECNELQTIIDSEKLHQREDGSPESEDFQDFDEAMVLGSLERLIVCYMKNMESIWKGPVGKGSLSNLKSLALYACPNLTTLFTIDMLSNLTNLEELIVKDCPKINSLVSLKNSGSESVLYLPSLKKISLLWLPGLVSISSGLEIALKLERMVIYDCPKLEKLSTAEVSSTELKVIKGEKEWWNALKWYDSDVSTELEDFLARHFIPLTRDGDLIAQLTKD